MPQAAIARVALASIFVALAFEAGADVPDVPGDDIFGFTTPTDVGNPGDTAFGNENDGRAGKRTGTYRALNARYELGHTFAPDWWVGASLFASHNLCAMCQASPTSIASLSTVFFRARASDRQAHRDNPFAVAVSLEPRLVLVDNLSGCARCDRHRVQAFRRRGGGPGQAILGLQCDLGAAAGRGSKDRRRWLSSSAILLSSAIAYQLSPKFFVGGEARYFGSFSTIFPNARGWTRGVCRPDVVVEGHRQGRLQHDVPATGRRPLDDQSRASARSRQLRKAQFRAKLVSHSNEKSPAARPGFLLVGRRATLTWRCAGSRGSWRSL